MRMPVAGVRVRVLLAMAVYAAFATHARAQEFIDTISPLFQDGPLRISGDPATAVDIANLYVFQPQGTAATSVEPYFQIENQPEWAYFDEVSGALSGAPAASDEGWYPNIRICFTDGTRRACLPDFSITVSSPAPLRTAILTWSPPDRNEDGSTFTDLSGYLIYSGREPNALVPMVSVPAASDPYFVFNALEPGKHYFAVSTLSASGGESMLSEIIEKKVD